ncbi:molybdate ABC transporter substrate-binding protein [Rubrimonas cliftonensis]|uniref:Molybdenum ABC transporter, molybdate-binding protein n=1 Tax=Rubrimonas cliftonensis TaxID=89524 RepID=A0A1H4AI07_9RHOB|nr:molybdate ABC transporter substrate-binding protein [Rubrimonas cliftonensis]SEA35371.1 molybdenum ABC transporter, molybdate-binding protein [Rubrimonas cliftonensis]
MIRAVAVMAALAAGSASAEPVLLHAAGSLRAALSEVAADYAAAEGVEVTTVFAASGTLRQRIEGGEAAQVFASANMAHPTRLTEAGAAGPVALFARNSLCALTAPGVTTTTDTLLDAMLSDAARVGTSTPKADPSGDYAFELFAKAEALRPGARAALEAKALQLTGAPDSPKAPEGRNQYAWVMSERKADLFLTYCTNAVLARAEAPELEIVQIPPALSVGADYGLTVMRGAPEAAWRLALHILSPAGQAVLARYGFESGALPRAD